MATNVYEGLFLLDSNKYGRDPSGTSKRIHETIESHGGEMLASRLWSEQKLAYRINGQRKGTYWLTYFRMDGTQHGQLEREFQLNEQVMRTLILKVDPRLVDALVAHAQGNEASEKTTENAAT